MWDPYIDCVIGAYSGAENKLQVEFKTVDGKIGISTSEEMRYNAPLKLLDFYEENLTFPE